MKRAAMLVLMLAVGSAVATMPIAKAQSNGDLTLPEGTRIVLQLNDHLSTRANTEGDAFTANVIVPVYQSDHLIIPKGSVVTGSISRILRPGRVKGKAVMNLLFQGIRIPGRGEMQIVASLARVDQDGNGGVQSENTVKGEGSAGRDAARVLKPGLAGAGIGALAGGARGAAIGSGVGAVVGIATIFTTRGKDLEMRRGSTLDIVLDRPLSFPLEAETRGTRGR